MANPNPDKSGFGPGNRPNQYLQQLVSHAIICWTKGQDYSPIEITDLPVLISKREMLRQTGRSYPTIWKLQKIGKFPAPVRVIAGESTDAAAD